MRFAPVLAAAFPACLGLLPAAASAFEWAGPDSDLPLNLSASSVIVTWDPNSGTGSIYSQLDLFFTATSPDHDESISWQIGTNLSLPSGQFDWDPRSVKASLELDNTRLYAGQEHFFEAEFQ